MQAKRATKKLSQRDKELLGSLPEYAKPASPIGEAWENHKKRLFSGAYERLTGEKLRMKMGSQIRICLIPTYMIGMIRKFSGMQSIFRR